MRNYYTILELSEGASIQEVKKRYKELSKKYHPDLHQGNALEELAKQKFQEINEAYHKIIEFLEEKGEQERQEHIFNLEFYNSYFCKNISLDLLEPLMEFYRIYQEIKNNIENNNQKIQRILYQEEENFINNMPLLLETRNTRIEMIKKIIGRNILKIPFPITPEEEEMYFMHKGFVYKIYPNIKTEEEYDYYANYLIAQNRLEEISDLLDELSDECIFKVQNFLQKIPNMRVQVSNEQGLLDQILGTAYNNIVSNVQINQILKKVKQELRKEIDYFLTRVEYILQKVIFPNYSASSFIRDSQYAFLLFHNVSPWIEEYRHYIDKKLNFNILDSITSTLFSIKLGENPYIKVYQNNRMGMLEENIELLKKEYDWNSKIYQEISYCLFPKLSGNKKRAIELLEYYVEEIYKSDVQLLNKPTKEIVTEDLSIDELEDLKLRLQGIRKISEDFLSFIPKDSELKDRVEIAFILNTVPLFLSKINKMEKTIFQLSECESILNTLLLTPLEIKDIFQKIPIINTYFNNMNRLGKEISSFKGNHRKKIIEFYQVARNIIQTLKKIETMLTEKNKELNIKIDDLSSRGIWVLLSSIVSFGLAYKLSDTEIVTYLVICGLILFCIIFPIYHFQGIKKRENLKVEKENIEKDLETLKNTIQLFQENKNIAQDESNTTTIKILDLKL